MAEDLTTRNPVIPSSSIFASSCDMPSTSYEMSSTSKGLLSYQTLSPSETSEGSTTYTSVPQSPSCTYAVGSLENPQRTKAPTLEKLVLRRGLKGKVQSRKEKSQYDLIMLVEETERRKLEQERLERKISNQKKKSRYDSIMMVEDIERRKKEQERISTEVESECHYLFTQENSTWIENLRRLARQMVTLIIYSKEFYDSQYSLSYLVEKMWKNEKDPYPSAKQMDAVLHIMYGDSKRRTTVNRVYQECFPWVSSSSSSVPRSLQHLSRYSIRMHLRGDDVDKLPIDDKLKKYIHLANAKRISVLDDWYGNTNTM